MKKYFEVRLISKTVQTKLVEAESQDDAVELANSEDWCEKEEMIDSDCEATEIDKPATNGRYILTWQGAKQNL